MSEVEKLNFVLELISDEKNIISSKVLLEKTNGKLELTKLKSITDELESLGLINKHIDNGKSCSKINPPYNCEITYKGNLCLSSGDVEELIKIKENKEKIEFEKSIIDLKLKKWQLKTFWPIFIFAFIGFGFSVYNFINNLTSLKKSELQEVRIEKMESELEKLQISTSNQKTVDSLNISKDLNNIGNTKKLKNK